MRCLPARAGRQRVGNSSPMPRGLKRYFGRQDFHFITFSCYQRCQFLQSDTAKICFLEVLGEVRTQCAFRLAGYVVMPEHVHLVLDEPPGANPARIIQILKQRVSRKLRESGEIVPQDLMEKKRFWQRRYFDFNLYSEEKLRREAGLHAFESRQTRTCSSSAGVAVEQLVLV